MPAQIWMMGIALTEIVHHIYIDFGVKPCHEHVNSQREKKLVAATRKKKWAAQTKQHASWQNCEFELLFSDFYFSLIFERNII